MAEPSFLTQLQKQLQKVAEYHSNTEVEKSRLREELLSQKRLLDAREDELYNLRKELNSTRKAWEQERLQIDERTVSARVKELLNMLLLEMTAPASADAEFLKSPKSSGSLPASQPVALPESLPVALPVVLPESLPAALPETSVQSASEVAEGQREPFLTSYDPMVEYESGEEEKEPRKRVRFADDVGQPGEGDSSLIFNYKAQESGEEFLARLRELTLFKVFVQLVQRAHENQNGKPVKNTRFHDTHGWVVTYGSFKVVIKTLTSKSNRGFDPSVDLAAMLSSFFSTAFFEKINEKPELVTLKNEQAKTFLRLVLSNQKQFDDPLFEFWYSALVDDAFAKMK